MLTAYDYPFAQILDGAGVDVLLVGDTLGMVVQGLDTTLPVTVDEIIYHTRMVVRGRTNALVVADLPFLSYQVSIEDALRNAGRMMKEGGAEAVKLEGGLNVGKHDRCPRRDGCAGHGTHRPHSPVDSSYGRPLRAGQKAREASWGARAASRRCRRGRRGWGIRP